MKRLFLNITMITVFMVTVSSCKDNAKSDAKESTTEATTAIDENSSSDSATGTPSFSDSDVQAYVDAYESYMEDYANAVESKDMGAFTALASKGQDLATKAQEISGKVTGTDAEKLTAYMTKKAKEVQELAKKMME